MMMLIIKFYDLEEIRSQNYSIKDFLTNSNIWHDKHKQLRSHIKTSIFQYYACNRWNMV